MKKIIIIAICVVSLQAYAGDYIVKENGDILKNGSDKAIEYEKKREKMKHKADKKQHKMKKKHEKKEEKLKSMKEKRKDKLESLKKGRQDGVEGRAENRQDKMEGRAENRQDDKDYQEGKKKRWWKFWGSEEE